MYTERNTDSISAHLNELKKINIPTAEEVEIMAVKALNGSTEAKEELIKSQLKLVVSVAKRYKVKELMLEDLIAQGNLSLTNAINSYKAGNNFTSWARTIIQRDLIQYVSRYRHTVKCTNHTKKKGREPLIINSFSDMLPGFDEQTYEDMLPGSTEQEEQEDRRDTNDNLIDIFSKVIPQLKPHQRIVIEKHYYDGLSFQEIAEEVGKTREAIRNTHNKSLIKLKELLTS